MTDIKTKSQNVLPAVEAIDVNLLVEKTGNLYEALAIIAKRANQINIDLKSELLNKLEEFAVSTETIEEVQENKEQIEISKFYEKMPNPALMATKEFLDDELGFRYRSDDEKEDEEDQDDNSNDRRY